MPLPTDTTQSWPPANWKTIYDRYAEHHCWYSGDMKALSDYYSAHVYTPTPRGRFWAKEVKEERRVMIHVPIASDIAGTSASMLFSEHPRIQIPEAQAENAPTEAKEAQARLEEIIALGGFYSRLLEAAESAAALGGVYLKVNWDKGLAPYPIISVARADNALPEFRFGILQAVTFWTSLEIEDTGAVWRWLERHEPGVILNGLYKGTADTLGESRDLGVRDETSGYEPVVRTGLEGLACRYVPNILPNRQLPGSYLGRSDYSGSESLMDALDEVVTSLIRDVRLGQGRIIAPESFFAKDPTGVWTLDLDREAYLSLNVPISGDGAKNEITLSQFNIRTEEHLRAAMELLGWIMSNAGYSPQSFGLNIQGQAESGTALTVRERKSFVTAAKKSEYWRPAIEDVLFMALQIDRLQLGSTITPMRPVAEIQDSVAADTGQVAASVEMMNRAQAASVQTRVSILHPEWEAQAVAAEVARILDETGLSLPSPEGGPQIPGA